MKVEYILAILQASFEAREFITPSVKLSRRIYHSVRVEGQRSHRKPNPVIGSNDNKKTVGFLSSELLIFLVHASARKT